MIIAVGSDVDVENVAGTRPGEHLLRYDDWPHAAYTTPET